MRERLLYPLKRSCSIVYQQMLRLVKEFREVYHDVIVEQDKVMGVNMTWRNITEHYVFSVINYLIRLFGIHSVIYVFI